MQTEIRTFPRPNGELQRVLLVRWEDWNQLHFLKPQPSEEALDCFADIYRKFLVPACPWLFGNMVLFHLPEELSQEVSGYAGKYGLTVDPLTAAAALLKTGVRFRGEKPVFRNLEAEGLYRTLEQQDCLRIARGKLPVTTIIPVENRSGFLTKTMPEAAMKVNASFFIMDRFDCATVYDHIGSPIGLCVKDGVVTNPPLYRREALLVRKDGTVTVEVPDLREMTLVIGGKKYRHGENCRIHTRPEKARVSGGGKKLVITGCRVAAVVDRGSVPIPASGFVLCPREECAVRPGEAVHYPGMEDVVFGIQVGNSVLREGKVTQGFVSRFYNIRHLEPVPYPPSLYPVNFRKARAARIVLGADRDGKPMLLWAEGAAKLGYVPGKGSCGASLEELGQICESMGMWNAVNLDGGGSAQILLKNHRQLQVSDRKEADHSEAERPVPLGLMIW